MNQHSAYDEWLMTLSDEEFENERFTVKEEWELVGMSGDEAVDKSNALEAESWRRFRERSVGP